MSATSPSATMFVPVGGSAARISLGMVVLAFLHYSRRCFLTSGLNTLEAGLMKHHSCEWLAFSPSCEQSGQTFLGFPPAPPAGLPLPCCPTDRAGAPPAGAVYGVVGCTTGAAGMGGAFPPISLGFTRLPLSLSFFAKAPTLSQPNPAADTTALAPRRVFNFLRTSRGRR